MSGLVCVVSPFRHVLLAFGQPSPLVRSRSGDGLLRFRHLDGETAGLLDTSINLSHAASPDAHSPAPARQRLRPPGVDVAALVPSSWVPAHIATDLSASLTTGLSVSARTRSTPPH